jgi:uroporphyrinogen-III decarboxylase
MANGGYLMKYIDFEKHNEEVRKLWDDFWKGNPTRAPTAFSMSPRMILLEPRLNPEKITAKDFFENPDIMWDVQLKFQKWLRYNVPQDAEMGPPEEWSIGVSFFNSYEAGWFGCSINYREGELPDTSPILNTRKEKLYEMEIPDPIHGNLMGRLLEYYEYFKEKRKKFSFEDKPISEKIGLPTGTDGPFVAACNLRGATEVCLDMYEDPKYFHDLMNFVTEGIIRRMKAWKNLVGEEYPVDNFFFADDSIELLSEKTYREFILPYHRKIFAEFSKGGANSIHLCGRASHLFPTVQKELNVQTFDLGFPTDLGEMRKILGKDVLLIGNIHPMLLRDGPKEKIEEAVKKLCTSEVIDGKKFILHDGNNCAPCTPISHFEAMYEAGKKYGRYD